MKQIALILMMVGLSASFGQERISAIQTNPMLFKENTKHRASEFNTLDSTFIYKVDTLDLRHVFDDFAINKFEQYNSNFTDPGVTSQLFYHLMNETNTAPQAPELTFCDSTFAHHDTVFVDVEGIELETVTHYPFDINNVWVNDLDFYPVAGELRMLYQECYILIDSVIDGVLDVDQDTIFFNTPFDPVFVQDSANLFFQTLNDTNRLWVDDFAYHNYTFAVDPWSLGVATFDGVDENGLPYEFGNESAYGIGDYLTSKPINLAGRSDVYLTFFYQSKGFGNEPEGEDSLLVDFWDPSENEWRTTTAWQGIADMVEPNQWDTAHIAIPISVLEDGFRFRFKNYASLSGALDHWHIDYVKLEDNGFPTADNVSDLAISYPVNTLLNDYTAVPWDHYKSTSGNEKMLAQSELFVYNSDLTATNFSAGELSIRNGGILQGGSPYAIPSTGLAEPNYLTGQNATLFNVASDYFYDQTISGDQAAFDVKVNIASAVSGANQFEINDTTYLTQRFDNYYAYDDGSAEAAYGIEGVGSLFAYKFEAYQGGELAGILMHFVPTVTDLEGEVFLLTVWADDGGVPGEIIYQDNFFESHTPDYSGAINGFKYYTFNNTDFLVDGKLPVDEIFYVGWRNVSSQSLNVGLDWNIANGDKIFFNTAGSWIGSSFDISLLIRPVFSTALDVTLSDDRIISTEDILIYPNPAKENITISGLSNQDYTVSLYDMSGREIVNIKNENQIDISMLQDGIYLINIVNNLGEQIHSKKLIKH